MAPSTSNLVGLPDDCIFLLFKYSHVLDIIALRQTCQRLNALTRSHVTWRTTLERVSDEGRIPHLLPHDLEAPAEDLEALVTRYFRLKHQIRRRDISVQCLQSSRWASPPLRDPSQLPKAHFYRIWPNPPGQGEFYRTAVFISPGFVVMGSYVRPLGEKQEYGYVSLWHLGLGTTAMISGGHPLAEYKIPSLPGAASQLMVSKEPIANEKNTYLVLVGVWTNTLWALIKVQLPVLPQDIAVCKEIAALPVLPRSARKTAMDMHGDFIVFLCDLPESRSVLLWNWREKTCARFRVMSSLDTMRNPDKGSAPILIALPFIIYIRTYSSTIHVCRIPTSLLSPLATYDLATLQTNGVAVWSASLPWETSPNGGFQLSTVKDGLPLNTGGAGAVTINVDFRMVGYSASAQLVISSGRSKQRIRPGWEETFDFQATFRDINRNMTADIVFGIASIPGSPGWLSPDELDVLLRRVIKVPREASTDHGDVEDYRVPVSRAELLSRIALDPILGRFVVLPDGFPGLYLVDTYKK